MLFFFSWIQSNPFSTRRERSFLPLSSELKIQKSKQSGMLKTRFLSSQQFVLPPCALPRHPPNSPSSRPPPATANFSRLHLSFFLIGPADVVDDPSDAMDEAMMSEGSIEMLVVTLLFDGESTPNPTEVGPQSDVLCSSRRPPDLTMTTRERTEVDVLCRSVLSRSFVVVVTLLFDGESTPNPISRAVPHEAHRNY